MLGNHRVASSLTGLYYICQSLELIVSIRVLEVRCIADGRSQFGPIANRIEGLVKSHSLSRGMPKGQVSLTTKRPAPPLNAFTWLPFGLTVRGKPESKSFRLLGNSFPLLTGERPSRYVKSRLLLSFELQRRLASLVEIPSSIAFIALNCPAISRCISG